MKMSEEGFELDKPQELVETHLDSIAKWLSCNGEVWGVGPTVVFASAAALFLYHELEATVFIAGDQAHVSLLEKTLVSTMVLGMLALMIHLWVCSMRFFQYYLDTLIRDSPSMLLEMTTAGLLGGQADMVPLGPLTRFLRQQQPQIHITFCWFLSLCYADYVRKHYCQRFNMPYLEQCGSAAPATPQCTVSRMCKRGSDTVLCTKDKDLRVRLISQSSETSADAIDKLRAYIAETLETWEKADYMLLTELNAINQLINWAKCGDSLLSVVPTVLWAVGAAALAHRLLNVLFRRFLFRRVPLWEIVLQNLLFLWMIIYSLHFWVILVRVLKLIVNYFYDDPFPNGMLLETYDGREVVQQWVIWICAAGPLAYYIHTRPRPEHPPLMIWITTSPWQRREMGPYGYYLNRPLSSLPSATNMSPRQQALSARKAFSDSKIIIKEPVKKKRHSKSI